MWRKEDGSIMDPEGSEREVLEEVKRHGFIPKRGNFIPIKRGKMMMPRSEAT